MISKLFGSVRMHLCIIFTIFLIVPRHVLVKVLCPLIFRVVLEKNWYMNHIQNFFSSHSPCSINSHRPLLHPRFVSSFHPLTLLRPSSYKWACECLRHWSLCDLHYYIRPWLTRPSTYKWAYLWIYYIYFAVFYKIF